MGSHPINLALRFLFELSALLAMGIWGWRYADGWLRFVLALAIPVIAAALWATFAVPDDPSRSGAAPVAVPGLFRLALEAAIFVFASWTLFNTGLPVFGWILSIVVALHYLVSYDRIRWLVTH